MMSALPWPERPNILHLLSDQHSPYVAGCYGDPVVQTPHLDSIAAGGVVFDAAYCPSPICVPSRMSMLTGRHPYQNECWTNSHILDSGIPTFAHALGAAGYRTAIVGRMHSIGPDQLRGYAERLVGDHSPNFEGGSSPPRGALEGTAGPARVSLRQSGAGQSGYQVHDEYVAAAAVDWLNREGIRRRTEGAAEPFLLTVGLMLPHQPFVARREDYARYAGKIGLPRDPAPDPQMQHPYVRWWRERTGILDVTEAEIIRARTAYWALVDRMDQLIGQVLRALRESGLAKNTLIVYTTDHGEQNGEHGLWWKQTFYEASARVPLLLSWPGVIPAGQRCARVVSALDVTATLLDAAGAAPLPDMRGRSLLGLVGAGSSSGEWDDVAFSEFCVEPGWYQRMIRRGPWKLNHYHGHAPQLFNLEEDPHELHDRAGDPACRAIREVLQAEVLDGWDGAAITQKIDLKRKQSQVLRAWARATSPADQYRWRMPLGVNYLDEERAT